MTLRALFVLLVVLNLGVGLWWLLHDDAPVAAAVDAPTGLARLQLVRERSDVRAAVSKPGSEEALETQTAAPLPTSATPAGTAPSATAAAVAAPAIAETCFAFGPFADAAAASAAEASLRSGVLRRRTREAHENGGRGWRVFLPPQADRAAADALAQKVKAAGYSDLMVVPAGADANSIALGRFSSEERAKKHASDLRAAGFPAQAQPLGEAKTQLWIDLAAVAGFDAAAARRASGAAQARGIDCAGMP